ncbi:Ribosomal N-lysine methyltransferase 1 [Wickerhamomyces ciferrii]|uniref:Ribosomal N-lysine methyltransferase 1 n=1 Tax=Wickerhamomyces ciferrii (strain ATCC 14091 / BCRC 22168 / CBS 111 / JCM 3599 / NBRC 0793 / NRRL Y-1031 F-60-10) TaxID=1206466 RepID=K0KKA5_WICCF|nr:Ribosomal N-lysine methyltransferase 1 [Wickerhamomyces ciferrii]CCH45655.1 Ribosomal N-lysine methyltransferase 1 [Wickerhamomyces ciferrii]
MIDDSQIQTLLKWGQDQGAIIDPSIQFKYTKDHGISVFVTQDIKTPSEKPQIKIPSDMIIHNKLALDTFGESFISKSDNVNSSLKLLVSKLKFDNTNDSWELQQKFKPFIDLLPLGKETGSVFYWSSEELRTLGKTNLAGSLEAKTKSLLKEWYSTVENLEHTPELQQDLKLFHDFDSLDHDTLVSKLLDTKSWTSFGAYLWSCIIFTSRAFPNEIINSNCKPGQAILLPIIDLLNHDNSTNVEWSFEETGDEGFFTLLNKDPHTKGDEIFNNYGAKSNEELLLGYGFTLEDNKHDTIALRIKLPLGEILEAENFGFQIPKIEDYTYFAFSTGEEISKAIKTKYDENEGMLFYINYQNLIPDNLLKLFQFKSSQGTSETGSTLRNKLNGLQIFRSALETKLSLLKESYESTTNINPDILQNAKNYKNGQKQLYKSSLKAIKHLEKELLHDYKTHVTTLSKIYKKSESFQKLLYELLNIDSDLSLQKFDTQDILILWIISQNEGFGSDFQALEYLQQTYQENLKALENESESELEIFEFLQELSTKDHKIVEYLKPRNINAAAAALNQNVYQRVSDGQIILVEPLDL